MYIIRHFIDIICTCRWSILKHGWPARAVPVGSHSRHKHIMPPAGPGTIPKLGRDTEEFYKRTVARIDIIQKHLSTAPRSSRLKDKVCIITGVGSLKGIGWVVIFALFIGRYGWVESSRATALAYAHEGAKHLYLLDFVGDNLPNLKETIETTYPDIKVCITAHLVGSQPILYQGHNYSRRCSWWTYNRLSLSTCYPRAGSFRCIFC